MCKFVVLKVEQNHVSVVGETAYAQLVRLFDCMSYDDKVDLLATAYAKRMQSLG